MPGRRAGVIPVVALLRGFAGDRAASHGRLVLRGHPGQAAGLSVRRLSVRHLSVRRLSIRPRPVRGYPALGYPALGGLVSSDLVSSGLVSSGLVLLVPLGAGPAQRGGHLLEAGHRPGFLRFLSAGVLRLIFWDDVATYDVAGSPRLAVLVLGHSNHLP